MCDGAGRPDIRVTSIVFVSFIFLINQLQPNNYFKPCQSFALHLPTTNAFRMRMIIDWHVSHVTFP